MQQALNRPKSRNKLLSVIVIVEKQHANRPLYCDKTLGKLPRESAQIFIAGTQRPLTMQHNAVVNFILSTEGVAKAGNDAVEKSTGSWLWFVSPDSLLDEQAVEKVLEICNTEPVDTQAMYYFDLYYTNSDSTLTQISEHLQTLRSRKMKKLVAEQTLLMPKALFEKHKGFLETDKSDAIGPFAQELANANVELRPIGLKVGTST